MTNADSLKSRIESVTGCPARAVRQIASSAGGGNIYRLELKDRPAIAKIAPHNPEALAIEAFMLAELRSRAPQFPSPDVFGTGNGILVMEYFPGGGALNAAAQEQAAEHLAALHNVTAAACGLERDTTIGPLHQPNPWADDWPGFFRDQRLLYMAMAAEREGVLPAAVRQRIERFGARIDEFLPHNPAPSLIHGDIWGGNVICGPDGRTGFIDPAIYYADPEIELAFTTMFHTFDARFYRRYHELRPIADGFFEQRKDIYLLYPYLTHVRIYKGGGYANGVERILDRLGF